MQTTIYMSIVIHRCMWTDWLRDGGASQKCVRSGIWTHAYKSRLRPERSALDRSAILTYFVAEKCIIFECWVRTVQLTVFQPCTDKQYINQTETVKFLYFIRVIMFWLYLNTMLTPMIDSVCTSLIKLGPSIKQRNVANFFGCILFSHNNYLIIID